MSVEEMISYKCVFTEKSEILEKRKGMLRKIAAFLFLMLNLYLCEYYLWYGKKGAGKLKMECCIRIFESGVARRRGSRIIGIVMIIMLAAGLVCELPALEFPESDAAYRMIYGKYY